MPPVRIHVGDDEVLLDDSRRYAERAVTADVDGPGWMCGWGCHTDFPPTSASCRRRRWRWMPLAPSLPRGCGRTGSRHENRCEWRQRPFGQGRRFGAAAALPEVSEVVAGSRARRKPSPGPTQGRFGDYDRPESLAEAYAGLDRLLIITTVDPEPGKRGTQVVAAIDAAVRAGVKHIVLMSAVGTRRRPSRRAGASYWRESSISSPRSPAWTILRMNFYAEAFVQMARASLGQGVLTGLAENRAGFVARDDRTPSAAAGILDRGVAMTGRSTTLPVPSDFRVRNAPPSSPKLPAGRWRSLSSPKSSCAPD